MKQLAKYLAYLTCFFFAAVLLNSTLVWADSPGHTDPEEEGEEEPPCGEPESECASAEKCTSGGCGDKDPCTDEEAGDPVRLTNGEFYYRRGFLPMSGGSYPLSFAMQYSNYARNYSTLGWGWAHSFNQRLYETDQNRIFIRDGHGKKRIFLSLIHI